MTQTTKLKLITAIDYLLAAVLIGAVLAALLLSAHGQQPPNITGAPVPAGTYQPPTQHYEPMGGGRYQGGILVWANPKSGIYHCHFYKNGKPNPHYGTVQGGREMTLDQAHAAGYRPSHHSECSQ